MFAAPQPSRELRRVCAHFRGVAVRHNRQPMPSTECPCDDCPRANRCRVHELACGAYTAWVDTGRVPAAASREPSSALFSDLAQFDDARERYQAQRQRQAAERRATLLGELQRQARRETLEHKRLVAAGLAPPRSKKELRRMQLARRRLRWKIDPSLRERHLRLKREDAIRRGRRKGAAPKGSEANRLHRSEAQRRRREAERTREGRTLTGAQFRELRERLGLSIRAIADRFGATYSAAKQWQRPNGPPAKVGTWLLARQRELEEGPAMPGSFAVQAPPAAAVMLGDGTHGLSVPG